MGGPGPRQGSDPRIGAAGSVKEIDNTNDGRVCRNTINRYQPGGVRVGARSSRKMLDTQTDLTRGRVRGGTGRVGEVARRRPGTVGVVVRRQAGTDEVRIGTASRPIPRNVSRPAITTNFFPDPNLGTPMGRWSEFVSAGGRGGTG